MVGADSVIFVGHIMLMHVYIDVSNLPVGCKEPIYRNICHLYEEMAFSKGDNAANRSLGEGIIFPA